MNSFSGNHAYRPYFLLALLKNFTVVTSPLGSYAIGVWVRVPLSSPTKRGGICLLFFLKLSCVAAPAAEIFYGFAAAEARGNGPGPGRGQNTGQFFFKNIAKTDDAVAV